MLHCFRNIIAVKHGSDTLILDGEGVVYNGEIITEATTSTGITVTEKGDVVLLSQQQMQLTLRYNKNTGLLIISLPLKILASS